MGIKDFDRSLRRSGSAPFRMFAEITSTVPEKSLLEPLRKIGGRNNKGRVTAFQRGGGHKRFYRIIDFKRDKRDIPARVASIEYDPNRSARIALLHYADGEKRYILAPLEVNVGDTLVAGEQADIRTGNAMPLARMPLGTNAHNIEMRPGKGGQMARSAGAFVQVVAKEGNKVTLKMPSAKSARSRPNCYGTIGQVSQYRSQEHGSRQSGRVALARPSSVASAASP